MNFTESSASGRITSEVTIRLKPRSGAAGRCNNAGMTPRFGLLPKLALFFLALALPALLAMDFVRATIEFRSLTNSLETDAMREEILRERTALARHLTERKLEGLGTDRDLERWVLQLARRNHKVLGEHALTFAEQKSEPLRAFLIDGHGTQIASSNTGALEPGFRDWLTEVIGTPGTDLQTRRNNNHFGFAVPLDRVPDRWLVLLVVLDSPAHNFLGRASIEWPIMLVDGLLFAVASAFFLRAWVTARLARMSAAAARWRAGDLQMRIADRSGDEIGAISTELDRVPDALDALMQARSSLAGADERARLARDLHDTVKQKTFGLAMQLAAAEASLPAGQRPAALAECRTLVADIQSSLVAIIDDLKPLPAVPLELRLQHDIEAWSRRSGIAVLMDLSGAAGINESQGAHVEAILSEALANVQRHSGARRVDIRLIASVDGHELLIVDDGRGGARAGIGRGLDHLESRAGDMPGGTCRIDSDDRGTRIAIRWTP